MELVRLRPGLHRWTARHPNWKPGADWSEEVGCLAYEAEDAFVLVDPLIPAHGQPIVESARDALAQAVAPSAA